MRSTPIRSLAAILQTGPACASQLSERLNASPKSVREAMNLLSSFGLVRIVGRAPKREGSGAPQAYVWGPGPLIRAWASGQRGDE